ncbi:hypothetical protein NODU109028_03565 [Nocardioides dubius]|uniref:Mce-associated membrane protein n=1 Tax=Nocardioides dubius TaxID=317019 RepID=A0ABP4E5B2_9ACTN
MPDFSNLSRSRLNVVLYVLVVAAACLALLLVILQQQSATGVVDRARNVVTGSDDAVPAGVLLDHDGEDLHSAVLLAGTHQAKAFMNVDYREIDDYNDRVLAGATGDFAEQYKQTMEALVKLTTKYQTVQTGDVVAAGVVAADQDNATVLVAMEGTVQNKDSNGKKAQAQRLQLKLVWEGGRWLTNDLVFVP